MHTAFPSLFLAITLSFTVHPCTFGKQYLVGDTVWSIPPHQNSYDNWSSSHPFAMGDSLLFEFKVEFHNVIQVTGQAYQTCDAENPFKVFTDGPAIVLLKESGIFYFLCNISNYCNLGQKVSITVQEKSMNLSPSPTPTPSTPSRSPETIPSLFQQRNSSEASGTGVGKNSADGSSGMLLVWLSWLHGAFLLCCTL